MGSLNCRSVVSAQVDDIGFYLSALIEFGELKTREDKSQYIPYLRTWVRCGAENLKGLRRRGAEVVMAATSFAKTSKKKVAESALPATTPQELASLGASVNC